MLLASSTFAISGTLHGLVERLRAMQRFVQQQPASPSQDAIEESPFQNLAERKQVTIKLSADKKELQQELLTEAVLNKLLSCKKSGRSEQEEKEWNALVWLVRWCGCRIAEVSILRWEDIDFDSREIKMMGKRSGNQRASSETMRVRLMALWSPLVAVLKDLKEHSASVLATF